MCRGTSEVPARNTSQPLAQKLFHSRHRRRWGNRLYYTFGNRLTVAAPFLPTFVDLPSTPPRSAPVPACPHNQRPPEIGIHQRQSTLPSVRYVAVVPSAKDGDAHPYQRSQCSRPASLPFGRHRSGKVAEPPLTWLEVATIVIREGSSTFSSINRHLSPSRRPRSLPGRATPVPYSRTLDERRQRSRNRSKMATARAASRE
jgi:hypothetical protein